MNAYVDSKAITQTADILSGMWDILKADISRQWTEITSVDLMAISGEPARLSQLLQSKYLLTRETADDIVTKLANHYDSLPGMVSASYVSSRALEYWSELTVSDAEKIDHRRSMLTSIVQNRYALTRETAWRQVNTFMAQLT